MTINTIAEALKKLYAKLGGTDNVADVPTVAEMIDKVTEVAGTGGGGLPEVTAADNGKLLGVDDGEWTKVDAPSSGSSVLYIEESFNENDQEWTLNIQSMILYAAIEENVSPIFVYRTIDGSLHGIGIVSSWVPAIGGGSGNLEITYLAGSTDVVDFYVSEHSTGYPYRS